MKKQERKDFMFESGRVVLSTGDLNVLEVNLASNRFDIDVQDKGFIKRVIAMRGELSQQSNLAEGDEIEKEVRKKRGTSPLKTLKTVAEVLANRGITINVSYKGNTVLAIGANARSTFLQLITKTRAVAITSFYNLLRMII